jgi:hypothetical protein
MTRHDADGQCEVITSCGECVASSRLDNASAVELVVRRTIDRTPSVVNQDVTSIVFHVPAATEPEDPSFAPIDPDG